MPINIQDYLLGRIPVGRKIDIPAYLMAKAASGVQELSGTLPLAVRSRASQVLKNYIIYGTASGAGVETENGYKLPLKVTADGTTTDYPVYIGDSQLMTEEYVDYESGKVYKRTEIKGLSEPLYGIGDYKDTLDLSTGTLTRRIKKLVLTGNERWVTYIQSYYITVDENYSMYDIGSHLSVCSHYPIMQKLVLPEMHYGLGGLIDGQTNTKWNGNIVFNPSPVISSRTDWISYLAQQYAAGTPVTVWYVLDTPTVETITVPSGLTGNIEGYLVQDETPTPTDPIYPTSNGTKQQDDTYSVYTEITPTDPPAPLPDITIPKGEITIDIDEDIKPQATIKGKIEQI